MTCSLILLSLVRLPKPQPAEAEDGIDVDHLRGENLLDPGAQPLPRIVVTSSTTVVD
jgi:hypothetical protein